MSLDDAPTAPRGGASDGPIPPGGGPEAAPSASVLAASCEALFGSGWRTAAARALGIGRETLWRYAGGSGAVPREVDLAVRLWSTLLALGLRPPVGVDDPWERIEGRTWESLGIAPGSPALAAVSSATLDASLMRIYGADWRAASMAALGVSAATLWRHATSGSVPGPVRAAVRALLLCAELGVPAPSVGREGDVGPASRRRRTPRYAALLLAGLPDGDPAVPES